MSASGAADALDRLGRGIDGTRVRVDRVRLEVGDARDGVGRVTGHADRPGNVDRLLRSAQELKKAADALDEARDALRIAHDTVHTYATQRFATSGGGAHVSSEGGGAAAVEAASSDDPTADAARSRSERRKAWIDRIEQAFGIGLAAASILGVGSATIAAIHLSPVAVVGIALALWKAGRRWRALRAQPAGPERRREIVKAAATFVVDIVGINPGDLLSTGWMRVAVAAGAAVFAMVRTARAAQRAAEAEAQGKADGESPADLREIRRSAMKKAALTFVAEAATHVVGASVGGGKGLSLGDLLDVKTLVDAGKDLRDCVGRRVDPETKDEIADAAKECLRALGHSLDERLEGGRLLNRAKALWLSARYEAESAWRDERTQRAADVTFAVGRVLGALGTLALDLVVADLPKLAADLRQVAGTLAGRS